MRWRITAGVLLTLALLIPASSAVARAGSPGISDTTCRTVLHADLRERVTIDLDTASDTAVRLLANQIMSVAVAESLTTLPGRIQARLDGTADDLRAFLKTGLQSSWLTDLRVAAVQTLSTGGANVKAAAQVALDTGTADALLAYLNHGLFIARAQDSGSFKSYADIRALVTIDLDTASDTAVRVLANQIMAVALAERLTLLPSRIQARLDGTPDDLRAYLKTRLPGNWSSDLRIAVNRTVSTGGASVQAAAQAALDNGTVDAFLSYLNDGLYVARALDCVPQPGASPSA